MAKEIKTGVKVKCLVCDKRFTVKKVIISWDGQFIVCPYCHHSIDVKAYQAHSEDIES